MIRLALVTILLAACGAPAMPKGPPPEYEEEPSAAPADHAAPVTDAAAPAPAPEHS